MFFFQVAFSKKNPFHLFSFTSTGQYECTQIEKTFLDPLVISKFTKEEVAEKQVENFIFHRNFTDGFQLAYELAEKHKKNNP